MSDNNDSYTIDYTYEGEPVTFRSFQPPQVKCYKVTPDAHLPEYGSELAACFDLKASLKGVWTVKVFSPFNTMDEIGVNTVNEITVYPGCRVLVPTGIIFDLAKHESLRIHPRSGLALKQGITIANCEGVVDADYVDPTYVMLINTSEQPFHVKDGDRIAQAEIVSYTKREIVSIENKPEQKTSRDGGFGSTGV